MSQQEQAPEAHLVALAAEIVSAYVTNNSVPASELSKLIAVVHVSLTDLDRSTAQEPVKITPPMPIKKTVTPDYLISLEDGRQYKSLKRHLASRGLTPDEYRRKWGLPADYPMVASNYAAQRSAVAKASGLGRSKMA